MIPHRRVQSTASTICPPAAGGHVRYRGRHPMPEYDARTDASAPRQCTCKEGNPMQEHNAQHSRPLEVSRVTVTDAFWHTEQELVRTAVIPFQWDALNDNVPGAAPSYCMHNFKAAARQNASKAAQGKAFVPPAYTFRGFEALPEESRAPRSGRVLWLRVPGLRLLQVDRSGRLQPGAAPPIPNSRPLPTPPSTSSATPSWTTATWTPTTSSTAWTARSPT